MPSGVAARRAGAYWYSAAFPDHRAARLFGVFDWNAGRSSSAEDFLRRIRERKPGIERLAGSHDRIVFIINSMPTWLSSSADRGTYEGGAKSNATAHPPRDWNEWARMVKGMAETYRDIESVDRCYEFWNEPDLEYWQGSLEDFLKLYEVTARAVKAGDPGAKFGGCAVNQWDGKIRKGDPSGPLVLELIRFAAKKGLPLDFISWHHFGRPLAAIGQAKERFLAECDAVGLGHRPELFVTEWSWPYRGTPAAATSLAETMVALAQAGVDLQTAACWEEFHAFLGAKRALETTPARTTRLRLDIRGTTSIEVLEAESVRMEHTVKEVSTAGGRLVCELRPYEVLRLRIRVE